MFTVCLICLYRSKLSGELKRYPVPKNSVMRCLASKFDVSELDTGSPSVQASIPSVTTFQALLQYENQPYYPRPWASWISLRRCSLSGAITNDLFFFGPVRRSKLFFPHWMVTVPGITATRPDFHKSDGMVRWDIQHFFRCYETQHISHHEQHVEHDCTSQTVLSIW